MRKEDKIYTKGDMLNTSSVTIDNFMKENKYYFYEHENVNKHTSANTLPGGEGIP